MDGKYWVGRRVLITGSSGFIGRRLLSYLQQKKALILGVSRHANNSPTEKRLDVSDKKELLAILRQFTPDICFHLASDALVEAGQQNPYETFHNNIVSTLNILEACRTLGIRRAVIASTAHVYGDAPMPFREDEPARPSRPYETSKTAGDLIAQSYADSFGLPVLIPRFVNIYGPGDSSMTRIIPKTVRAVLDGKPPTLWGGNAQRDYLYIDDVLRAYELLGSIPDAKIGSNKIFNFATGHPVSARELIGMIITVSGKSVSIDHIPDVRSNELVHQDVDWSKAKQVLGWSPSMDLSRGLAETIRWFRENPGG